MIGAHSEHVEPVRGCFENRHRQRIAETRYRRRLLILGGKPGENRLRISIKHEPRRGHLELIRPVFPLC